MLNWTWWKIACEKNTSEVTSAHGAHVQGQCPPRAHDGRTWVCRKLVNLVMKASPLHLCDLKWLTITSQVQQGQCILIHALVLVVEHCHQLKPPGNESVGPLFSFYPRPFRIPWILRVFPSWITVTSCLVSFRFPESRPPWCPWHRVCWDLPTTSLAGLCALCPREDVTSLGRLFCPTPN